MKKLIYFVSITYLAIMLIFLLMGNTKVFNYQLFKVVSGSMIPEIKINDLVISKETKEVSKKDIVVYKINGGYVTHRIVSITGDEIVTKGDFNNALDDPIKKENIVGKVLLIVPNWLAISYKCLGIIIIGLLVYMSFRKE